MLSKRGNGNLQVIQEVAQQLWNSNVQIGNVEIIEAPFDLFNLYLIAYGNREVCITYDRSIVGLEVKLGNEYVNIRRIMKDDFVIGFESSKRESLLHNMKILDSLLCFLNGKREF